MRDETPPRKDDEIAPPQESGAETVPWEEIEEGRYMPRRTRGSCRGRVLG
jgi:hypothetical protein